MPTPDYYESINRNFDKTFVTELEGWLTIESDWPAKRTYKLFKEWFEVEIHSMIAPFSMSGLNQ